jgi:methylglutaconyl-CoA hydratase
MHHITGGGVVLVFLADVRIFSPTAWIQFSEVKRGLLPAMISCYIVPSLGPFLSKELMITGRRVDAKRCYEMGFVTAVGGSEEEFHQLCNQYIGMIKTSAPEAVRMCKELVCHR